jgi:predicted dehydrogenase
MSRFYMFCLLGVFVLHLLPTNSWSQQAGPAPMKIGVVGLVHSHVHWILNRASDGDFEIVGIAEPNRELAQRFLDQYQLPMSLVYPTIEQMLDATQPQAVTAFNTIRDHLTVVELCAPRGIHVMVEKPLAVNLGDALKMSRLAKKHQIHLLTNYETTWYGSHHHAMKLLSEEPEIFGEIRKIVVHDGHPGPKEIGVDPEFLEWLTDPYWNGAGALTDFGCYGANLSTWLHNGEMPREVFAVTQQIKPDIYPKVEDEATIILTYEKSQTIIQASWNWNYNRKDIEIYGQSGYIHCLNGTDMRVMRSEKDGSQEITAPPLTAPEHDPFTYFMAVVKGEIIPEPTDLSSLRNNLVVMAILQAAKFSAEQGKKITLGALD